MAIADHQVGSDKVAKRNERTQPFAEVDAKQFRRAQKDAGVKKLHAAADRHLEQLEAEGRIDL